MALHIVKDQATLMTRCTQAINNLSLPGGKFLSLTPGSTARLLLTIVNAELEALYEKLEEIHLNAFVSTAKAEYLDLIGGLLGCERTGSELDDDYRYRISNQVTILEKANMLSIRMALLQVDGVQDVKLVPYTHGSGSFTAFIVTNTSTPTEDILLRCEEAIAPVVAYGIKYNIEGPDLIPVQIGVKLVMEGSSEATQEVIDKVKDRLRIYINSKNIGEELIYNELIEIIMGASEDIYDMNIYDFKIDGLRVLNTNQRCRKNERFIESDLPDSITVS